MPQSYLGPAHLIASNIHKAFDSKGLAALKNVTLDIRQSGLYFLMGPSGHGKSTLLKILSGTLNHDQGNIQTSKEDILWANSLELENSLDTSLQTFLGELCTPKQDPIEEARSLALELNLEKHLRKTLGQLSQGQRARAWLGRWLAPQKNILLMDEPFIHLDQELAKELTQWLKFRALEKNQIYLIASHERSLALAYAKEILFLYHGQLIEQATPEAMYFTPKLSVVAKFWGDCNLLLGEKIEGGYRTRLGTLKAPDCGKRALFLIRPEDLSAQGDLTARVTHYIFLGTSWTLQLELDDQKDPLCMSWPLHGVHPSTLIGQSLSFHLAERRYHVLNDLVAP